MSLTFKIWRKDGKKWETLDLYSPYLLFESLMYKLWFLNTILYFHYNFQILVNIEFFVLVQNLRKEICINFSYIQNLRSILFFFTWRNKMIILGQFRFLETVGKQVHLLGLVWTRCIMHPVDPPHLVLRISHSSSLPPIKTPRTPPPPLPPSMKKIKIMTLLNP
jgi:hypothetical protein